MTEQEELGRKIIELHKKNPEWTAAQCADVVLSPVMDNYIPNGHNAENSTDKRTNQLP